MEHGVTDDGRTYLVMELARGTKMGDMLKANKPLPPETIFSIMRQVAEVLEAARQVGIIHRDIKPDNFILDEHGNVKVLDFGLVRDEQSVSLVSAAISMTGKSIGTPAYMSPERCRRGGREIDHRSDLYSLGITAYHVATGKVPFSGPTPTAFSHQHEFVIPEPIEKLNPVIPKPLCAIIYRLMAKSPADRYQTAAELLADSDKAEQGEMPARIYRFPRIRQYSPQRVAITVLIAVIIVISIMLVWYFFSTDIARTELHQARSLALQAAETGNYSHAVEIINSAISKHPRRTELITPLEELRDNYVQLAAK